MSEWVWHIIAYSLLPYESAKDADIYFDSDDEGHDWKSWHETVHVEEGKLPGQCGHGEFLWEAEGRDVLRRGTHVPLL